MASVWRAASFSGHIGSADGSSFVRIGTTGIICGLKLEYVDAGVVSQTSGHLGIRDFL